MTAPVERPDSPVPQTPETDAAQAGAEIEKTSRVDLARSSAGAPERAHDNDHRQSEDGREDKPTLTTDPDQARDDAVGRMVEPENS